MIVFLVVFIDLLGFGIVLPLLPLYATEILQPLFPAEGQEALRGIILGLLMASFSAMQFLFAPVWGRLSDRVGRRPILLLGLAASVVFYTLFGIASEIGAHGERALALYLLFAARLGAGLAGATISTAQAVIADSTPPERRAHGMALIGAAFGIGFTFGPLLGFASLFLPWEGAPGFAAAGLSLAALLLGLRRLPETLKTGTSAGRRRWLDWHGLLNVLKTPTVGSLVVTFFLTTLAFGGLESTLALVNRVLFTDEMIPSVQLTREALKTGERTNFLIFAYVGLVLMLTQGFLYRRLVLRVGEVRFMKIGIVCMALGMVAAVAVLAYRQEVRSGGTVLPAALGVLTLAVVGFALLTPSVQSLISRRSDPARQGEVLGVNQSASALARILGPMLSAPLFFSTPSHVRPYVFGAGLLVLVFLLTLRIRQEASGVA
jgi:MFS family permease